MELPAPRMPDAVERLLERLWHSGHAAYLVGGGLRDWLLGRPESDWDIATDALPERIMALFPSGRYENRFGTVTIDDVEVTTFRRDHQYADRRRPDSVTFTTDLASDLARRDFTVNAICWGRAGHETDDSLAPGWVDPTGGLADLEARRLRAVGDPTQRFDEDALRLLRAARLAAQLDFEIEPATLDAMRATAGLVGHVSNERVGAELRKMLRADPPSRGFVILAETGLLAPVLPVLAAFQSVAGRLDADEAHGLVRNVRVENADRVGAAAHARQHRVGLAADRLWRASGARSRGADRARCARAGQ